MLKRALHLGCGTRIFPHTPDIHWVNMDLHPPLHNVESGGDIEVGSILDLGRFREGEFDLIHSEYVFEHLTLTQICDLLYQMNKVLKDDGKVNTVVPNFLHILARFEEACLHGDDSFATWTEAAFRLFSTKRETRHASVWTPSSARAYLTMCGFFRIVEETRQDDGDGSMSFVMVKA